MPTEEELEIMLQKNLKENKEGEKGEDISGFSGCGVAGSND